jgi:hypothetical protein
MVPLDHVPEAKRPRNVMVSLDHVPEAKRPRNVMDHISDEIFGGSQESPFFLHRSENIRLTGEAYCISVVVHYLRR